MSPGSGIGNTKRVLLREIELRRGAVACPTCDRPLEPQLLTKHHIRPRSMGGPTTIDNLVLVCRPCHDAIHREPGGVVVSRLDGFLAGRVAPDAFPPPPEPLSPEEGLRLFFCAMTARLTRVTNRARFLANPPFDPYWPVGRLLYAASAESPGVALAPAALA